MTVKLLLYFIAFALLLLAGLGINPPRVSLGWLGLAVWLFAAGILPAFD